MFISVILYIFFILIIAVTILIIILCIGNSSSLQTDLNQNSFINNSYIFINNRTDYIRTRNYTSLISAFKEEYMHFYEKDDATPEKVIQFIQNNKDSQYTLLIFCCLRDLYDVEIIDYLQTIPKTSLKIIFCNMYDYWHFEDPSQIKTWTKIFEDSKDKYYVTTCCSTKSLLQYSWPKEYTIKNKNMLYDYNWWHTYDKADKVEFVESPKKNLVCVSGAIDYQFYPERYQLSLASGTEVMPYNLDKNYVEDLSQYTAALFSPVYLQGNDGSIFNSHLLVLKFYEILASGSLLLTFESEKKYLEKVGLYHQKNCWLTTKEKLQDDINYILDTDNREFINQIRLEGKVYSQENTAHFRVKELMTRLEKI